MDKPAGKRNAYCSYCRKSYLEVGPLVEGPDEVYICGACIGLCGEILAQEMRRRENSGEPVLRVPTRESIEERFDQFVANQSEAKEALIRAALRRYGHEEIEPFSTVLLIGSSHASRFYLARAFAYAIETPFAHGNSEGLVKRGNEVMEGLLYQLLDASDFDALTAQFGVVYLDGIDDGKTQEKLVQLWERIMADDSRRGMRIDFTRLLFICGGEFAGLDDAMYHHGRHPQQPVTADDLKELGMIPSFVGRLQGIARVNLLDEDTLMRIVPLVDFRQATSAPAVK